MKYMPLMAIKQSAAGAGEDVDGSADTITIPNKADGSKAEFILVTVSEDTYVRVGASGDTVSATNGVIVTPESGGMIFACGGQTTVHHLQVSTAGRICVTPLEA